MYGEQHSRQDHERGIASLEWMGVGAATLALVVGLGIGMRGESGTIAGRIGDAVTRSVVGTHERRIGGGTLPVRAGRGRVRLPATIGFDHARRRASIVRGASDGLRVGASGCWLCASASAEHGFTRGIRRSDQGIRTGLGYDASAALQLALAAAQATATWRATAGAVRSDARGRVRAAVGAEADAELGAHLGRGEQSLTLAAGGMAGASASAEGSVGLHALGIAISQSGSAAGWAGAGVEGRLDVRRAGARIEWDVGWGAALGIGGSARWRGAVDLTGLPGVR